LAVIVSKAYNQDERLAGPLLAGLRNNRYEAVSDVNSAIDGLSSRPGDYFESGRDRALLGAKVVNALRNADPASPMRSTWDLARDNALTNPRIGSSIFALALALAHFCRTHLKINSFCFDRHSREGGNPWTLTFKG
jgi:hypothetical protein